MNILLKYSDTHYGTSSYSVVKPHKGELVQVIPPFNCSQKDDIQAWYRKDLSIMPTIQVKSKRDLTV